RKSGLGHRAKRTIQFRSEVPIHASDHVVLQRHAGFLRGFRILPPEVLGNVLRQSFVDGPRLALVFDLHLDPLLHLNGVDLWRSLVQRPEVLVDAGVRLGARIESFGAYGRPGGVCTGSVGLAAANSTGGVAGCGIGGGSGKATPPFAMSATETPCSPSAVVRG